MMELKITVIPKKREKKKYASEMEHLFAILVCVVFSIENISYQLFTFQVALEDATGTYLMIRTQSEVKSGKKCY